MFLFLFTSIRPYFAPQSIFPVRTPLARPGGGEAKKGTNRHFRTDQMGIHRRLCYNKAMKRELCSSPPGSLSLMIAFVLLGAVSACGNSSSSHDAADAVDESELLEEDTAEDPFTDADALDTVVEDLAEADVGDEETPDIAGEDAGDMDIEEDAGFGCVHDPLLGDSLWPPQASLSDADTLELEVVREWTELHASTLQMMLMRELRYTSWQIIDCTLVPVRIEAFYAIPQRFSGSRHPAIVMAHGLGGCSDSNGARDTAARLAVAVLYYTGPGNCGSEGVGNDDPMAIWDTVPDPRGSWFWAHAVAGGRAISVLATVSETDPGRLGMTGYSAGSMATLNVNGFDSRLVAVVPVSGVGDLGPATEAGGWENTLLEIAGLTPSSAEYTTFLETVDPINQAPDQHGAVMLVNGAQDEFFPIDSTVRTFEAFPGDGHRLVVIPNWDHGLFASDLPLCGTWDNSDAAAARVEAAQAFWFGHHLAHDASFPEVPPIPTAAMMAAGPFAGFVAELSTGYSVTEVRIYASNDGSYNYLDDGLDDGPGSTWQKVTVLPWDSFNDTNTVYFAEFHLRIGLFSDLWLTSIPALPPGFAPRIRPIDPLDCS